MNKRITFRNREHSQTLDSHINEQLERVEEFLQHEPTPVSIEVVVDSHDTHQYHRVSAHVKSPNYNCFADHTGDDLYTEIHEVIDRVYRQLRREKKELVDKHTDGCGKACQAAWYDELDKAQRDDDGDEEEEPEEV